jgi:cell shape-determining protein MreC
MVKNIIVSLMRWLKMKYNYLMFIIVFLIVLFRGTFINLLNNINSSLFIHNDNLEIKALKIELKDQKEIYQKLLDFKNNIVIKSNYKVSNVYKNNYNYDKLIINGCDYKVGDEVINQDGLVGIISRVDHKYSEINYLYNSGIPVVIDNYEGKIVNRDKNNNLIIKEISNYNTINKNDLVYSIYGTYIGKVIDKKTNDIDATLIVKGVNIKNINYVAVISR